LSANNYSPIDLRASAMVVCKSVARKIIGGGELSNFPFKIRK